MSFTKPCGRQRERRIKRHLLQLHVDQFLKHNMLKGDISIVSTTRDRCAKSNLIEIPKTKFFVSQVQHILP